MKKTYFLLFLAALTAACLLAGCKKAGTTAASSDFQFTGYPMNARDVTVSWADLDGETLAVRYGSAAESPYHTGYSDKTGVTIDWVFPTTGTSGAQMYAQLMAGTELPYIIQYGIGNEAEQLIAEGVVYDLSPYIEKWMPNYYAYLQTRPERDKTVKTDSRKYYTVGFFREDGPFMDTWVGPIVRKDWLDAQGLPMPATIDDWDKTLRVFKEKYGAMLTFEKGFGDLDGLCGAFGAYSMYNFQYFVDKNGKLQAANIQSEYRNYLAKLNEWWRDGLLDPDHLTIDTATFRSRALEGKVGLSFGALSRVTALYNDAQAAKNGADWMGFQYPKGADGTLTKVQGGWGASENAFITTSCPPEKLEITLRLMDYAFTEEGFLYTNYGNKGVSWDYDASGRIVWSPQFLNDVDAPDYQEVARKYGGMRGSGPGIQATHLVELVNAPISFEAATIWFYPNEEAAYQNRLPNGMSHTASEGLRVAELQNTINTYVAEMSVSFVTGQAPLSQFDSYVARLNQMGLAELLSLQQAAYDRYQAR